MLYYIYWIKKKEHNNIFSEGYVGISNSPERRLLEHSINKSMVGNNIRKYRDDIEIVVLYQFNNKEDALSKEKELRPRKKIGWNIAVGGQTPPEIKNNTEIHKKISNTLKKQGANPYSEKTHSKETIEKSKETRLRKRYRWYYNEITLETKQFATSEEEIPTGWKIGKKPKINYSPKIRGTDYKCNTKLWDIFKNGEYIMTVENLKEWCYSFGIKYIASSRRKKAKKLSDNKKVTIIVSENNTIIENGIDTKLTKSEYAKKIDKARSYITSATKKGFYEEKTYDWYTCRETK